MSNWIANFGWGESGGTGNKAGDQTGKEGCIKLMYFPYGTSALYILRYPDIKVARHAAADYAKAAKYDYCGYDMAWANGRNTLYEDLKACGWNMDKLIASKKLDECDCSSGINAVWACYVAKLREYYETISYNEYRYHNCLTTYIMVTYYKQAGFEVIKYTSGAENYQRPGDIYLYESHHTYMAVNYGDKVTDVSHEIEYSLASDPDRSCSFCKTGVITAINNTVTVTTCNQKYQITTKSDPLNIRATYNTACSILGQVPKGTTVTATAVSSNGWIKITYSGITGWVSLSYCTKVATATSTTTATTTEKATAKVTSIPATSKEKFTISGTSAYPNATSQFTGTVSVTPETETLNVRQHPGTTSALCTTFGPLPNKAKVEVCDAILAPDGSRWYFIQYNNKFGYCWANCVKG